ncbi:MAG: 30S ribosomal protein S4 [Thermoplasmata archaeon]|nr:30S ribosomal protein S4 [Thermoplasmata archaeon]
MGDPKFPRRKYDSPSHPWQGERIKFERELVKKYGLKNKKELWRAQSLLRRFRQRSRILQAQSRYGDEQAEKETEQLLTKLGRQGMLPQEGATLDDVLALDLEAILSRRLQTMAYVKGLGYSPNHARQLIVHGHIAVDGRKVTIPGYTVKRIEEGKISYHEFSPLAHDMHPARPDVDMEVPAEPEDKPGEKTEKAPAAAKEPEKEKTEKAPAAAKEPEKEKTEKAPAASKEPEKEKTEKEEPKEEPKEAKGPKKEEPEKQEAKEGPKEAEGATKEKEE